MAFDRSTSLLLLCEHAVAENAFLFPVQVFEELPHVLLAGVAKWLCPRQLLRLDAILKKKGIDTDETWKVHYEFRWRKFHETSNTVFVSTKTPPQIMFINKHFQEVFYLALEGRWEDGLHLESKMNQCVDSDTCLVYKCLSRYCQPIPLTCKQELVSNLHNYSEFINRYPMNCAHATKLLDNPDFLNLLHGVQAIKLIRLTDSNVDSTVKLLNNLRLFGSLSEINILTCPLSSENCAKFLEFCLQIEPSSDCNSSFPTKQVDNIILDTLLGDLGFTFYDKTETDSYLTDLFPPSKRLKASTDDVDVGRYSSMDVEFGESSRWSSDDDQLFDTALMEPLSAHQTRRHVSNHTTPDETRMVFSNIKDTVPSPGNYSLITQLSIDDSGHNINMTSLLLRLYLPRWSYLTALAVEGLSNHVETKTACLLYQRIKYLFEYPTFRELHVTDSSNLCILLALMTAKREEPLSMLKLDSDRVSAGICSCVEASQHISDWSSAEFVKRLELVFCTGHLYIDILQKLVTYDKALTHLVLLYTAFRLSPGDLDIGHILTSLHAREDAGMPGLHTIDLSKTCLISTFQDYLIGTLSPMKLASLCSLNLSSCNLYLMDGLKTVFTDDLVTHPNLRELYLAGNSLEKTGCFLLLSICTAITDGKSKVKILDLSDNKIAADDLLPVAVSVNSLAASSRRGLSSRSANLAHTLLLNQNFLAADDCKRIKSLFGELFLYRVEVKVADFDFDAEHLSQM